MAAAVAMVLAVLVAFGAQYMRMKGRNDDALGLGIAAALTGFCALAVLMV